MQADKFVNLEDSNEIIEIGYTNKMDEPGLRVIEAKQSLLFCQAEQEQIFTFMPFVFFCPISIFCISNPINIYTLNIICTSRVYIRVPDTGL